MARRGAVMGSILKGAALVAAVAAVRALTRRRFEDAHASRFTLSERGIVIGAEPIALDASRTHAVLLLHGFNDTPQSLRPLADALHREGWTVRVPLLPGHGRSIESLVTARAADWLAHARAEYAALRATHDTVAICGQSMGAALAALVASETPDLPALVLLAPFIGVPRDLAFKFAIAWLPQALFPYRSSGAGARSIHDPEARARALSLGVVNAPILRQLQTSARAAEAALPAIRTPTLFMQSREDNRVSVATGERNFAALGSRDREQRWLTGCGHILTVDYCKDDVARETAAWLARWAGAPEPNPPR